MKTEHIETGIRESKPPTWRMRNVWGVPREKPQNDTRTRRDDPLRNQMSFADPFSGPHVIAGTGYGAQLAEKIGPWATDVNVVKRADQLEGPTTPTYNAVFDEGGRVRDMTPKLNDPTASSYSPYQMERRLSYNLGQGVRNLGMGWARNTWGRGPLVGGLATAGAGGLLTALLVAAYNRFYQGRAPIVPSALTGAGAGLGLGAWAGHSWMQNRPQTFPVSTVPQEKRSFAMGGGDPSSIVANLPIPATQRQMLLAGLLRLDPSEVAALSRLLIGMTGMAAGAIIARFLGAKGLLGLGMSLAGGLLASKLSRPANNPWGPGRDIYGQIL